MNKDEERYNVSFDGVPVVPVKNYYTHELVEMPPPPEWEVLVDANQEKNDYDYEFREKVRSLDGHRCQISGDENIHVCHLKHRGVGGDDTRNQVELCITLSPQWHDRLDGRAKPEIKIVRWNRDDPEGGLEVWIETDQGWGLMPKDDLWFYAQPTEAKGKRFDEIREEIKELAGVYKQSWWLIVERLKEIRDKHLYVSAGYSSFKSALSDEFNLFPEIDWKYKGSWLSKNFGALALSKTLSEERGNALLRAGVEKAYQISTVDNPELQEKLIADVVDGSATEKQIRQKVKEHKHGIQPAPKSCIQCVLSGAVRGTLAPDGDYLYTESGKLPQKHLKIHDKSLFVCSKYGHIVNTMSKEKATEVGRKCPDFVQR